MRTATTLWHHARVFTLLGLWTILSYSSRKPCILHRPSRQSRGHSPRPPPQSLDTCHDFERLEGFQLLLAHLRCVFFHFSMLALPQIRPRKTQKEGLQVRTAINWVSSIFVQQNITADRDVNVEHSVLQTTIWKYIYEGFRVVLLAERKYSVAVELILSKETHSPKTPNCLILHTCICRERTMHVNVYGIDPPERKKSAEYKYSGKILKNQCDKIPQQPWGYTTIFG